MNDLKISRISGCAVPVFAHELSPSALDSAEAADARREWLALNEEGLALQKARNAKSAAWAAENSRVDFPDEAAYLHALARHTRDDDAAVNAHERKAEAALLRLHNITRSPGGRLNARDAAQARDKDAKRLWAEFLRTMADRDDAIMAAGTLTNAATREALMVSSVGSNLMQISAMVNGMGERGQGGAMLRSNATAYRTEAEKVAR